MRPTTISDANKVRRAFSRLPFVANPGLQGSAIPGDDDGSHPKLYGARPSSDMIRWVAPWLLTQICADLALASTIQVANSVMADIRVQVRSQTARGFRQLVFGPYPKRVST